MGSKLDRSHNSSSFTSSSWLALFTYLLDQEGFQCRGTSHLCAAPCLHSSVVSGHQRFLTELHCSSIDVRPPAAEHPTRTTSPRLVGWYIVRVYQCDQLQVSRPHWSASGPIITLVPRCGYLAGCACAVAISSPKWFIVVGSFAFCSALRQIPPTEDASDTQARIERVLLFGSA